MKKIIGILVLMFFAVSVYAAMMDVYYNKVNGKVYMLTPQNIWTSAAKTSWINSNPSKNQVGTINTTMPAFESWIVTWEGYEGKIWYVNNLTNPTSLTTTPTVR